MSFYSENKKWFIIGGSVILVGILIFVYIRFFGKPHFKNPTTIPKDIVPNSQIIFQASVPYYQFSGLEDSYKIGTFNSGDVKPYFDSNPSLGWVQIGTSAADVVYIRYDSGSIKGESK